MRDENKSAYYVGKPVKDTDTHNMTSVAGYNALTEYFDIVNENAESVENGKFGDRQNERVRIAHNDNDGTTPNIAVDDGVWLERPTVDENGRYQKPPFIVESVQGFGRNHVYVLKRTLNPR